MSVLGHVTYDLRKIDGTAGGSLVVLGVKGQSLFSEVTKGRVSPDAGDRPHALTQSFLSQTSAFTCLRKRLWSWGPRYPGAYEESSSLLSSLGPFWGCLCV